MKVKAIASGLLLIWLAAMAGCAMGSVGREHLMRGQIVDVTDAGAYLSVGSHDGAKVGDEFKVYKINRAYINPITSRPSLRKEETGTVKITEIVDEHFAVAKVLTGKVEMNSMVELSK